MNCVRFCHRSLKSFLFSITSSPHLASFGCSLIVTDSIAPFFTRMTLSATSAKKLLCVTMTTVLFFHGSFSPAILIHPVLYWYPVPLVGSSHSRSFRILGNCPGYGRSLRSHPDICCPERCIWSPSPTRLQCFLRVHRIVHNIPHKRYILICS